MALSNGKAETTGHKELSNPAQLHSHQTPESFLMGKTILSFPTTQRQPQRRVDSFKSIITHTTTWNHRRRIQILLEPRQRRSYRRHRHPIGRRRRLSPRPGASPTAFPVKSGAGFVGDELSKRNKDKSVSQIMINRLITNRSECGKSLLASNFLPKCSISNR